MSVRSVVLFHVAVPLKKAIKHASHSRTVSDNLVVRVTLASGHVGHGEGVPRSYVTGETIDTTFVTLAAADLTSFRDDPADFADAVRRIDALLPPQPTESDPRGMHANAARSALELALLDAYGRRFGQSLGSAIVQLGRGLGLVSPLLIDRAGPVRYSGAITAESARKERISAWKMRVYGFDQVKVKVGVAGQDDPARLADLRRILGRRIDIRLDANEAWHADEVAEKVRPLLAFGPTALEQPVPHAEVGRLAALRPGLGVPIMLDESLCSLADAERATAEGTADVLNVRISKCGGIGPTLRIVALAQRAGLGLQLGCHPGETGLLSAAGRQLAGHVRGFRYIEGSYDRHVLAENLIDRDITFGYGGRARPLDGPGLGVDVVPEALERMTVRRQEVAV